jgi:hypothetical protein
MMATINSSYFKLFLRIIHANKLITAITRIPFNHLLLLKEKVSSCLRIPINLIHPNKLRLVSQCLPLNHLRILFRFISIQHPHLLLLCLLHLLLLYLIIAISTIHSNTLNFKIILFNIFTSSNQNQIFTSKQMSPFTLNINRNKLVTPH